MNPAPPRPGRIAFVLGAFAALLTSFYSWRLIFLTFFGRPRFPSSTAFRSGTGGAKTGTSRASMPGFGMNCSRAKSSTRFGMPRS